MCGIFGYIGPNHASEILLEGLKRLEYRGYDSAGIATLNNGKVNLKKGVGSIELLDKKLNFLSLKGNIGIGHTRWATHGEVNDKNAHPHFSCSKKLILVHNGIIENFVDLKNTLNNHKFVSDTDSEVIVHYFEEKFKENLSVKETIKSFLRDAKGTFAILILNANSGEIYAVKKDSPLTLGIGNNEFFIASDIYAFSKFTEKAIFFEDNEFAIINKKGFSFYDKNGLKIPKKILKFNWTQEEEKNKKFEHHMLKEIFEQPECLQRIQISLNSEQKKKLLKLKNLISNSKKIIFVAAGSSYHASLYGSFLLNKLNFDSRAIIASEFKNYANVDKNTLVIAVSQSGETMDVLDAIKAIKNSCYSLISIVNVPYSSIQRECFLHLNMLAGQEICVASTKTFTNEILIFLKLAQLFGLKTDLKNISKEMEKLIKNNLNKIKELAKILKNSKDIYILGKGPSYPVAREIALKLKEISYIHAEGLMSGELKHGTLALIEEGVPVISLIPEKNDEIIYNVKEVESRKALSIKISPYYGKFRIPNCKEKFPIFATTIGFLLTYYIAKLKNLPIDKPRNLAKSVTVK